MSKLHLRLIPTLMLVLAASAVGCGGGGGGGGGGEGRTTDTAIRLIHGSIDGAPLSVRIGTVEVQKARFVEETTYARVAEGPTTITVERANSPGVVLSDIPTNLAPKTEYTLFFTGRVQSGGQKVVLLTEPVERPEEGFARVQFLNSVVRSGTLTLRGPGFDSGPIAEGETSGYRPVPMGPASLNVIDRNGRTIGSVQLELADQGEATVLAAGSIDLGVVFTRVYTDLD